MIQNLTRVFIFICKNGGCDEILPEFVSNVKCITINHDILLIIFFKTLNLHFVILLDAMSKVNNSSVLLYSWKQSLQLREIFIVD